MLCVVCVAQFCLDTSFGAVFKIYILLEYTCISINSTRMLYFIFVCARVTRVHPVVLRYMYTPLLVQTNDQDTDVVRGSFLQRTPHQCFTRDVHIPIHAQRRACNVNHFLVPAQH